MAAVDGAIWCHLHGMTFLGHDVEFRYGTQQSKLLQEISCFALVHFATKTSQEGFQTPQTHHHSFRSAYHHQRLRLFFMAERKTTCKEAWNQDLTDHRALCEQLRTIRANSFEERHGRGWDWKAEKNVTEMETILYNSTNTLISTSKSMTEQEYDVDLWFWFFIESLCSLFDRDCVWILFALVWAVFNLYTFFRIFGLRCTLTSYIPTHHQVLHVHSQTTKRQRFISIPWTPNGYARQNRHPNNLEKTPIGIPCSEEKRNKTIWTSHVENMQIGFTILYYSSQSCKQLIRHI